MTIQTDSWALVKKEIKRENNRDIYYRLTAGDLIFHASVVLLVVLVVYITFNIKILKSLSLNYEKSYVLLAFEAIGRCGVHSIIVLSL